MVDTVLRSMPLPWSQDSSENRRFAVILALLLIVFVPLALVIPRLTVPEPTRQEQETVPPQLARLVQPPKPVPKVVPVELPEKKNEPAPKPAPEPQPKPEPKPEPKAAPEPKPKPKPEPRAKAPAQQPESVEHARAVAQKSGILAMQDQLSAMQDMAAPESTPKTRKTLRSSTRQSQAPNAAPVVDTDKALAGSGGVKGDTQPKEQIALAERKSEHLKAASHPDPAAPVADTKTHRTGQGSGPGTRAMANIRRVFDQNKTSLFLLYNHALRQDPLLQGKVLLELIIEPDGSVSSCRIVSSELAAPALEQKIVSRVKLFNFGKQNVEARKVRIPINFLPP